MCYFTTTSSNQILNWKTQDTIDAPTTEETETALMKLKNNTAPGTDNIPDQLLKVWQWETKAMPEAYIFINMDQWRNPKRAASRNYMSTA